MSSALKSAQTDHPARPKARSTASAPLDNPRHEAFAVALAKGMSASTAYVSAGYSFNDGNAIRLKGNERIKARVEALQARVAEKAIADKAYVLAKATKLFEACEANVEGEDGFNPKAANAASRFLDQIGRHVDIQAWKDTSDVNVTISVDQAIARLEVSAVIEAEYEVISGPDMRETHDDD